MIEGLIFAFVLTSPVWLGYLVARPGLNPAIIKRIRKRGRHQINTRLAVWDPTRGRSARLIGRARASYWLAEDGQVHLIYTPHSGPERHLTGPLPPPPTRSESSGIWLVIGVYVLAAVGGDTLGYELSSGDDASRSTVGLFGAIGGVAIAYVILHVGLVAKLLRRDAKPTE